MMAQDPQRQEQVGDKVLKKPEETRQDVRRSGNPHKIRGMLDDKVLRKLSRELGLEWGELATNLDFSDVDILNFKRDNPHHATEQIFSMLVRWRQNQLAGVNQTDVLCTALEEVKRRDLAIMLQDHVQNFSDPSSGKPSTSQEPPASETAGFTVKYLHTTHCWKMVVGVFTLLVVILALYLSTDYHVPTSQESCHPSNGPTENQPSTPQEPTTEPAVAQTPELVQSGPPSAELMANQSSTSQELTTPPSATQTQAQSIADRCEQALKLHYRSTGSYVQTFPWVDDQKMHIMDIYTRLHLKTYDDKNKYSGHEGLETGRDLNSYQDIFDLRTREGDSINIAVLSGLAGSGKTTLLDKMAYDWAVDPTCALRQFKLVFLLRMHALAQSSELIDAIFDQLLDQDTDVEKNALNVFIEKYPNKVLILLDGFDELKVAPLHEKSFGSIFKTLNRKRCRRCYVVVTTRPSHLDRLVTNQLVQQPFIHVRVLGFTAGDVKDYVHKFYSLEHDNATVLLERIRSSDILSDLAESPMLLLMMCVLWREDSTIPETMSRLYSKAVNYIFKRKEKDAPSPEEVIKIVISLGKIGLRGLLSQDKVFSFNETELEKDILGTAIKSGLLTRRRVPKGLDTHNSVHFIHKTFQEFCAAKYLQSLLDVDRGEFQKVLNQIMSTDPLGFGYLLRFCAGDNEACSQIILQIVQENFEEMSLQNGLGQLALHCYFESQSEHLPPEVLTHSFINESISFSCFKSDYRNSLTHFLKRVIDQTKDSGNVFFAKVKKLELIGCDLTKYGASLLYPINAMTNLHAVSVMSCQLNASSMKEMLKSLNNRAYLAKLHFAHNQFLGGSAALWSHCLKPLKNLTKVRFYEYELTAEDMKDITDSLHDLPKLVELDISESVIFSAALWSSLAQLEHLQSLNLWSSWAGRLENKGKLSLSGSEHHGGSAAMWYVHLKHLKNLQRLHLPGIMLTGEDFKNLTESLSEVPNLVELSLDSNQGLSNSAKLWFHNLKHLKRLQKLQMMMCWLTGEDLKYLAKALSYLLDLVDLNLSHNRGLGGSVAMWSDHLKDFRNLQSLDLRDCLLTVEDVQKILESTSALPNFTELDLSGSHLGGSAELWSVHLKRLKHLQKLHLGRCSLTGEDIKHITAALSDLPDLTELDLHSNEHLRGSAALWSHYLKNFKKLQTLNLWLCSMTGEDMKYITRSLSNLTWVKT